MKIRNEVSGIHFFDRKKGLHILLDEIKISEEQICRSPRTVSIALTNVCDLKCHFCYAPKSRDFLEFEFVTELCKILDELGVLEITLGGGEPTLYPKFEKLCDWIWNNTSLGISFTTHGHHLTKSRIEELSKIVSSIRFSIDGLEPYYSSIRNRKLGDLIPLIEFALNKVHVGFNTVVSSDKTIELLKVIEFAIKLSVNNLLIIPQHLNGVFQLEKHDWKLIEEIISAKQKDIELLITQDAGDYLDNKTLENAREGEFLFAHISADKRLKKNSFDKTGIKINDLNKLSHYFSILN